MVYYYYSRVSSIQQNTARQIENFKLDTNFKSSHLFIDKVSGNIPFLERTQASLLFDTVTNSKDKVTIVIDSIDRLGRSLIEILRTIELFTKNKVNLKSLKEGLETLLENGKENPTAQLVFSVMGSLAQMERLRIKERSAEGIAIAKAMGKYKGRKYGSLQSDEKLLSRHVIVQKKLLKGLTIREINEITGCSSATIIKVKKVMLNRKLLE
jgi:DNA invertase Pin-like site-specific DNA recombinase